MANRNGPVTPGEPPEGAKIPLRQREAVCARCQHFNGICTVVFPQAKGCRSLDRYRPGWLAFAANARNACPLGRWTSYQE